MLPALRVLAPAAAALALASCGGEGRPAAQEPPPARPRAPVRAASPAVARACAGVAARVRVPVRCPRVVPRNGGGFERPRDYDVAACRYLLNLEPRSARSGITHLLVGGRCEPWDLEGVGRRFTADDLRLVGVHPLEPGGGGGDRVGLLVLDRLEVAGGPALLLRAEPYPVGGIHGGHLVLVFNAGGHGYVVSGHLHGTNRPRPRPAAVAALRAVAERVEVRRST